MIEIDIFSDTVCPWCYIGKRRLERALQQRPQPGIKINWRAFQLNPEMPASGMERQTYLETKFGGTANAKAVYDRVREAGAEENIDFAFDAIKHTPNTIASHRLIRYAGQEGRQDEVVQGLFDAYFVRGRDIGDFETLTAVASDAGLASEAVLEFLASDALEEEVRAEDAYARKIGIQGVPCFIFNGQHALSGAHPPEVFFQLFDLAREDGDLAAPLAVSEVTEA